MNDSKDNTNDDQLLDFSLVDLDLKNIGENEHEINGKIAAKAIKRIIKKIKKSGHKPDLEKIKNSLLIGCTQKALKDSNLIPCGPPIMPKNYVKIPLNENKDFIFVTHAASLPIFDFPDLSNVEIFHPPNEVTEEEIKNEINEQCWIHGERNEIEFDPQPGDELLCDLEIKVKGESSPYFNEENITIKLPKENDPLLINLNTIDIDSNILYELKNSKQISFEYISEYGSFGLFEKNIISIFKITYKRLRRVTPCSIDKVLSTYGTPSEAVLTQQIRLALKDKKTVDIKNVLRKQAMKNLFAQTNFNIPNVIKKKENDISKKRYVNMMQNRSFSVDEIKEKIKLLHNEFELNSAKTGKRFILFNVLSKEFGSASSEVMMGRLATLAQENGLRPEDFREKLIANNTLEPTLQNIHAEWISDQLVKKFKTKELATNKWEVWANENKELLSDPDF